MPYVCPFCQKNEFEKVVITPHGFDRAITSIVCSHCRKPIGTVDHIGMAELEGRITQLEARIEELQKAPFNSQKDRINDVITKVDRG